MLFPVTTLGPGERLGIWTLGCLKNCEGCANPELKIFDPSKNVDVGAVLDFVKQIGAKRVTISGGEPFLQPKDLRKLIEGLIELQIDDILVYSGFLIEELQKMQNEDVDYVLTHIAVLIDGPFVQKLFDNMPLRGYKNQRILFINKKYEKEFIYFLNSEKKIQVFIGESELNFIGIPILNYKELYLEYEKDDDE